MLAKEALSSSQDSMKKSLTVEQFTDNYVLLPTSGSELTDRFSGPYVTENKVSETEYVIHTPERRWLCHINMLKPFQSNAAQETALQRLLPLSLMVWWNPLTVHSVVV